MTVKTLQDLRQEKIDIDNKLSQLSDELKRKYSEDTEAEYSKLNSKRVEVMKDLSRLEMKEKREAGKRDLPPTPDKYLTSKYYFDVKDEIIKKEAHYKEALDSWKREYAKAKEAHYKAIVNGTDEEVKELYKQVEDIQNEINFYERSLKLLQSNKQLKLELTAMEVFQSREHINDLFKEEREALVEEYNDNPNLATKEKIDDFNERYSNVLNEFSVVFSDLENNPIGTNTFSKYREANHSVGIKDNISIKVFDKEAK